MESPIVKTPVRVSIFSTLENYVRFVFRGARSVAGSCATALPYLFGVGEMHKEVTELYPDPISSRTPDDLPARSRGLLHNDIERCIGCKDCERTCPTQCIRVETQPGADPSKKWVTTFDIDHAKCVFCGLCTEVCGPGSLTHTKQYEGAVTDLSALIARFGRGEVTAEHREKWEAMRRQAENDEVML